MLTKKIFPSTQCTYSTTDCDSHDGCACNQFSAPFEVAIKRYHNTADLSTYVMLKQQNELLRIGLTALRAIGDVKRGVLAMEKATLGFTGFSRMERGEQIISKGFMHSHSGYRKHIAELAYGMTF